MIQCLVISVDINNAEASINTALETSGISAEQFLQAVVLQEETKNNSATIVVFYEV